MQELKRIVSVLWFLNITSAVGYDVTHDVPGT